MAEDAAASRPLRLRGLWQVLGLFLVAAVVAGSVTPDLQAGPPGGDKVAHLVSYGACGLWFGWIYRGRGLASVVTGLIGLGVLLEVIQLGVPGRHPDALDMLANAAGVTLGALATLGAAGSVLEWLEDRLLRRA